MSVTHRRPEQSYDVQELNEALQELEQSAPRQSEIVELRFFAGLRQDEVAAALGISVPTVEREWRKAKLWLHERMTHSRGRSGSERK